MAALDSGDIDSELTATMASRLREIEETTRTALAQRQRQPAIEIAPATHLIPVPRRARMFRRHGEGHGAFSDVTLTGPVRD